MTRVMMYLIASEMMQKKREGDMESHCKLDPRGVLHSCIIS